MQKKNYSVIIPKNVYPKPSAKEISAAYILLDFFNKNIQFVARNSSKTPDFLIDNKYWELKSPTGDGKRNLQHTVSRALKQSSYIIVDARFSKIHIVKIKSYLENEKSKNKQIKKLLLINKQKNVIEILG